MMDGAKIQLSEEELNLVQNAGWLLTKNNVIDKVIALYGALAQEMQAQLPARQQPLPTIITAIAPKISKGEKYEGLPYVMLDYPRHFGREETFAIRTFFWWGHFFSITLHLKGAIKEQYRQKLIQNIALLRQQHFYICIAEDEWLHNFREDNYMPLHQLDEVSIGTILSGRSFCKISAKIPLQQWDHAHSSLMEHFHILLQSLGH